MKKLSADLEMKLAQRDEMKEKQRMLKEGIVLDPDRDSDSDGDPQDGGNEDDDELFGPTNNAVAMDIDS